MLKVYTNKKTNPCSIMKTLFRDSKNSVSSVSTAMNERGEGTVVAVRAYIFRCTSFPFYDCIPNTTEKETGFSVSKQSQAPK